MVRLLCGVMLAVGVSLSLSPAEVKDQSAKEPVWKQKCLELLCECAQPLVSNIYFKSTTPDPEKEAAVKLLEEAAEKGDKQAILALAALDEAWLSKAVETGSPDALYMQMRRSESVDKWDDMYKMAMEKGHAGFLSKLCTPQEFDLIKLWEGDKKRSALFAAAEKRVKKGNIKLMSDLGGIIINNTGADISALEDSLKTNGAEMEKSEREYNARSIKWCKTMPKSGIRWLVTAAESGHEYTYEMLIPGILTRWDEISAARKVAAADKQKLEKAKAKGLEATAKAKALCDRGDDLKEDPQQAMTCYMQAVKAAPGSEAAVRAKANLVCLHLSGKAGQVDKKAALQLLNSIFENGCPGGVYGAIYFLLRK